MTKQEKITRLIQAFAESRRSMGKGLRWHAQITKAQYDILWEVDHGAHRVVDIAKILQTTPSAATQLVQQLVENGYLRRESSSTDRRESILQLTEAGQSVLEEVRHHMLTKAEAIATVLSDEELEQFITITHKIAEYLKQKEE